MIFGDPNRFAVAMELDEDRGRAWLDGKLSFWIGGKRFGDWEPGLSLHDAITEVTMLAKDNGHRENCKLFHLAPEAAFEAIHGATLGNQEIVPIRA